MLGCRWRDWSGQERGHAKPLQIPLLISRGDGMVRACRAQFLAPHLETTVTGATHPSCKQRRLQRNAFPTQHLCELMQARDRGVELSMCGDLPLGTSLRFGRGGSCLPRNIHPTICLKIYFQIPCLQREGHREHVKLSSGNTNHQHIPWNPHFMCICQKDRI